ncbi:MAG: hypothetical protein HN919_01135 [Verrucomicrobia bacterium]|nr:hypothetical protein [Verrucomicrobiota bacterium]
MLEAAGDEVECHKVALRSILGVQDAAPRILEAVLARIQVRKANKSVASVRDLMKAPGGADLADGWHDVFKEVGSWLSRERRAINVFGSSLGRQLDRLSRQTFAIEWEEVPSAMATEEDWDRNGDRFWSEPRALCPPSMRKKVIHVLRVKDGRGKWFPLVRTWLVDNNPVNCFEGVVQRWNSGNELNSRRQGQALDLITQWGLRTDYEDAIEQILLDELPDRIELVLGQQDDSPLTLLSSPPHTTSRKSLATRWKRTVEAAEEDAAVNFLCSRPEVQDGVVFLHTDISWPLRRVIEWLPTFCEAPSWLDQEAVEFIGSRQLVARLTFKILAVRDLTIPQMTEMGKLLLASFHQWRDQPLSENDVTALDDLFARATGNWEVRLSAGYPKFLRNLVAVPPDPSLELQAVMEHSGGLEWHGTDRLPTQLQDIESLVKACLSLDKLKMVVEARPRPQEIDKDAVSPALLENPGFTSLETLREDWHLFFADHLSIVWKHQEQRVCEIRDALFAFDGDRLFVSDRTGEAPGREDQSYNDVLAIYLRFSNDSEVRRARDKAISAKRVYMKYRTRIAAALREKLVAEIGYSERHILRELLQNAESAYASMRDADPTAERTLCIEVAESADQDSAKVDVQHRGRPFNETDCDGNPRDDVQRIVSIGAIAAPQADGEVGRFNRGFKSVFNVTNLVEVVSGDYAFAIEDLLLLQPETPTPDPGRHSDDTIFRFECSRQDIPKLLGYRLGGPTAQRISVFSAATFPFLRHITNVTVSRNREKWTWLITREEGENGWRKCRITDGTEIPENFLVWHGCADLKIDGKPRRVSLALRVDDQGIPVGLEKGWNRLYLTFPCEDEGPCGALVNGDFDTDQGRIGVRFNDTNAILIKTALSRAVDLMDAALPQSPSERKWIAWANLWQVRAAKAWIDGHYEVDNAHVADVFDRAASGLLARVPFKNGTLGAENFTYPSRLMRALIRQYGDDWRIDRALWIGPEIESCLRDLGFDRNRYGLADLVSTHAADTTLLARMHAIISGGQFRAKYGNSVIETQEIDAALHRLERILQPPPPPVVPVAPEAEEIPPWSIEDLFDWWTENQDPDPYTLEGSWWPLLVEEASCPKKERSKRLKDVLTDREQNGGDLKKVGRLAWYKVLSIACLMSTGRRVTQIQKFWRERLDGVDFWNRTAGQDFGDTARACFEGAITSQLQGENASGEDADFWRRVFYDIRKVHHLVYRNSFAETVLDLASREDLAPQLLVFLRNGSLPNQPTWRGVLGQSAGSPLFFIVRELRRLKVIESKGVEPSCFFVCKPVRRAAYQIGWIDAALMTRYDFASLSEISGILHERYSSGAECGKRLLKWFDIPLLHYAQKELGS